MPTLAPAAPLPASELLNRNLFFVKNAVRALELKTSDKFDVYDPVSQELLLELREPNLGASAKLQRFLGGKHDRHGAFNLVVSQPEGGEEVLRIARPHRTFSVTVAPSEFTGADGRPICVVKKKWLSLRLTFRVFTSPEKPLYEVQVKNGWNVHRFLVNGKELASLQSRWKGTGSDFFKKGFQHALAIEESVPVDSILREFLIAFGLAFHRLAK